MSINGLMKCGYIQGRVCNKIHKNEFCLEEGETEAAFYSQCLEDVLQFLTTFCVWKVSSLYGESSVVQLKVLLFAKPHFCDDSNQLRCSME